MKPFTMSLTNGDTTKQDRIKIDELSSKIKM